MSDVPPNCFNIFKKVPLFQTNSSVVGPFYEFPVALHVFEAVLLNDWQQRYNKLEKASLKLSKIIQNFSCYEENPRILDGEGGRYELKNQSVFKASFFARQELRNARQAQILGGRNLKYENTKNDYFGLKHKELAQIEKKTENFISQKDALKCEFQETLGRINEISSDNEDLIYFKAAMFDILTAELDNMLQQVKICKENMMKAVKTLVNISSEYEATSSHIEELESSVSGMEVEKQLLKTRNGKPIRKRFWKRLKKVFKNPKGTSSSINSEVTSTIFDSSDEGSNTTISQLRN